MRHVHATLLLRAGVPVHVVAARLGHADPAITLRVYAHVLKDQDAAMAQVFATVVDQDASVEVRVSNGISRPSGSTRPELRHAESLTCGERLPGVESNHRR